MDDDLVAKYAAEAKAAMEAEAARAWRNQPTLRRKNGCATHRFTTSPKQSISFPRSSHGWVPFGLPLTGTAAASPFPKLSITRVPRSRAGLDRRLPFVRCCTRHPRRVKGDLEADDEVHRIRFSSALLDTFDDLGREFILAHGKVNSLTSQPTGQRRDVASLSIKAGWRQLHGSVER